MKRIELTRGLFALVDDEDFDFLIARGKWKAKKEVKKPDTYYAVRAHRVDDKYKYEAMHRLIVKCPRDKIVLHLNGNPLDNRKENLKITTLSEATRGISRNNKTGHKGVSIDKSGYYKSTITYKGKMYFLGIYKNKEDAALAYKYKARRLFGDLINSRELTEEEKNLKKTNRKTKRVICLCDGRIFDSISEAAKSLSITVTSIVAHLKGKKKRVSGYVFNYYTDDFDMNKITHTEPIIKKKSSKYKGVCRIKRGKNNDLPYWRVAIEKRGINRTGYKHIGYFKDELQAAKAYNDAALEYIGPNAKLNILEERSDIQN